MIKIRKAIPEDIDRIVEFQQKMSIETESLKLNAGVLRKGVSAVFISPEKGFYIVAEVNHIVVASAMLTPEWSDWRNGTFLWIQSVYVGPDYRKKRIYTRMYSFVRDMVANSDEYLGLRLYVVMNNYIAQQVYTKTGMDGEHYKMYEWIK